MQSIMWPKYWYPYISNNYTICTSNKYDPQMPHIRHMPELLHMHAYLTWEYANKLATYAVATINDVSRITVHRR